MTRCGVDGMTEVGTGGTTAFILPYPCRSALGWKDTKLKAPHANIHQEPKTQKGHDEGRTAIAHQGKWQTNIWHQPDRHADIQKDLYRQHGHHARGNQCPQTVA